MQGITARERGAAGRQRWQRQAACLGCCGKAACCLAALFGRSLLQGLHADSNLLLLSSSTPAARRANTHWAMLMMAPEATAADSGRASHRRAWQLWWLGL